MTKLSANVVKFISVDRQKLDLSRYITYGTVNSVFVEIQPDSANIKNDSHISYIFIFISSVKYQFSPNLAGFQYCIKTDGLEKQKCLSSHKVMVIHVQHHANISIQAMFRPPDKSVYQKIIFLISQPKHMM